MITDLLTHPALWAILGILLLVAEIFMPAFLLLFFGGGALAVSILTFLGITTTLPVQLLAFVGLSLLCLFVLRERFTRSFTGGESGVMTADLSDNTLIGSEVIVDGDFAKGRGKVTFRGASWSAESDEDLKKGDIAWVTQNRGIVLLVSRAKI